MSANKLDTTTYNEVAANTVFDAVLDAEKILAWRQNVKNVVDQHAAEINSIGGQGSGMYRQAFINGNFDRWERGISFTNKTASLIYGPDRWAYRCDTLSQQSTNGSEPFNAKYFARLVYDGVTNVQPLLIQRIEGVRTFAGQKVKVSFWAKSPAILTPEHIALNQNFGSGGSAGVSLPLPLVIDSSSWKKYEFDFSLPSISGKSVTSGDYLEFVLRFKQNVAMTLDIAQVQICLGDVALPFQPRHPAEETSLCRRTYERIAGQSQVSIGTGVIVSTTQAHIPIAFSSKRIAPTIKATIGGTGFILRTGTGNVPVTAITATQIDTEKALLTIDVASGLTAGGACVLRSETALSFIDIDAEL